MRAYDILVNAAAETAGFAAPPGLAEVTGEFFASEINIKTMGYLRSGELLGVQTLALNQAGHLTNADAADSMREPSALDSRRNAGSQQDTPVNAQETARYRKSLFAARFNVAEAARQFELSRARLAYRLKRHGVL